MRKEKAIAAAVARSFQNDFPFTRIALRSESSQTEVKRQIAALPHLSRHTAFSWAELLRIDQAKVLFPPKGDAMLGTLLW